MPCPEFEDRVLDYDQLAAGERAIVDAHVARCGDCHAFFSVLRELDDAFTDTFAGRRVSTVFADRIAQKLHREPALRPPSLVPEILDGTGWAAVFAILLWLAMFFVPELDFSIPLALTIGTIVLTASFGVAFRCYGALRRS